MPLSVSKVIEELGLKLTGQVKWDQVPNSNRPGIYIVSMSGSPEKASSAMDRAPISLKKVKEWLDKVQLFELDGQARPHPEEVSGRLSEFWLADESILYIGKAPRGIAGRVKEYYRTDLGNRAPHRGGHWIKTLSILKDCSVYFAESSDPAESENEALRKFIDSVSLRTRTSLRDPAKPFPFANLEYPKGKIKNHGLSNTTLG